MVKNIITSYTVVAFGKQPLTWSRARPLGLYVGYLTAFLALLRLAVTAEVMQNLCAPPTMWWACHVSVKTE